MTVSVTVVRPCSVRTPTAAIPGQPDASLRIRCGRAAASSSSLGPRTILPVTGTPAAADVQTTTGEKGLVVSVNF
jgi:hypothetical protein